jgi:hypothetical protein
MNSPTFSDDDNLSLMNEVLQRLFGPPDIRCCLSNSEKSGLRPAVPVLHLRVNPSRNLGCQSRYEPFVEH